MPIPPTAEVFSSSLDPHEELDFRINLYSLLEDGEAVATGTWTLEVLAEGAALGLEIMSGAGRDATLTVDDRAVIFWLTVNPSFQDDVAFDEGGVSLPMRITFDSDALPARKRQRTFLVPVEQR